MKSTKSAREEGSDVCFDPRFGSRLALAVDCEPRVCSTVYIFVQEAGNSAIVRVSIFLFLEIIDLVSTSA
jgi:hypothetical protein